MSAYNTFDSNVTINFTMYISLLPILINGVEKQASKDFKVSTCTDNSEVVKFNLYLH